MGRHLAGDQSPVVFLRAQFQGQFCSTYLSTIWMQGLNAPLASFADTKLGGAADSLEGQEAMQRNLDRLEHWAMINGMKLNKSKCQILHLGWSNTRHKYNLGEEWLESSPAERDLGVLVDSRLTRSQQGALVDRRTNCNLECIKHSIKRGLSSCIQHWCGLTSSTVCSCGPHKDVKVLKCVQRRATNLVKGLEGMFYEEWLTDFGLV
ncbi:hypothetical protein llap_22234 [Limosa lapponica baueri]|uniref:Rna-directed dna polymerase from mobile element jockey-like n=1 Tax=Limosa lapponica baueri TaxID=1758121 RepID=A0A2I0T114_LIMLA|nr:hypothetical protein llap_22234 [Limosa lapponica baueri]